MTWGTTYVVTTELLPPGHPLFAALVRSLPAGIIALVIARRSLRGVWWLRIAILGTLNIGLFFPLLFVAAQRLPGGAAATLGATQPMLVAVLAVALLSEHLSRWRLMWGALGVVGVGLVVLSPAARLDPWGVAAGIAGATSMGVGNVLAKRWGRPPDVGPVAFAGWQLAAGGLVLLPPTAIFEGVPASVDLSAIVGYAWLGIVGGLAAYSLWFWGIGRLPVTATALLGLLSPLVAALLGAMISNERMTVIQSAGFALALVSLVGGQFSGIGSSRGRPATGPR